MKDKEIVSTTRVYQYGAVPTSKYPEEAIQELFRANRLWNSLVKQHDANFERWNEARCENDGEYASLQSQLIKLENEIDKAFAKKRDARQKAGTRDANDPLIMTANKHIDDLKKQRRDLWSEIKPVKRRVDEVIDKKALNNDFRDEINETCQVGNTDGLNAATANEVCRNFKEARSRFFQNPGSRLRFHRFDGTGYCHYRFRVSGATRDGVPSSYLFSKAPVDHRSFILEEGLPRRGVPRWKLRARVAGGRTMASRVYAEFDIVVHRPIPQGAQINNAKLVRRRVGDRFRYTVNFSVRVPVSDPLRSTVRAIGVDIGFRGLPNGTMRAATIASTGAQIPAEHVVIPEDSLKCTQYIENLQSRLDASATDLGDRIKTGLRAGSVVSEDHPKYKLVRSVAKAPSTVTMSFEQAYKMAAWFIMKEPDTLPLNIQTALEEWWKAYRFPYREMHNLRAKAHARRREHYRIIAARLVKHRLPIGVEHIDLSHFAETKDVENPLSNRARYQRVLVANSEFIGAIKNAAAREGIPCYEVPAANTSKRCHACQVINRELKSELEWTCPSCGAVHDRDENAAINIAAAAEKMADRIKKQASAV